MDASFRLNRADFSYVVKQARVFDLEHISIRSDGSGVHICAADPSGVITDTASVRVGEGNGNTYEHAFKIDNLRLIDNGNDYDVSVYGKAWRCSSRPTRREPS